MSTPADIAIYGGSAGGGKSWAAVVEPLRHIGNQDFGAVIFRRTLTQVTAEGGLWDEASGIYPLLGATSRQSPRMEWLFPSGSRVTFAHLQYEQTVQDWQGSQIPLLIYDELTHFTAKQFWYMLSRSRSTCGVRPYIRATCNPDPDSFVAELISWWIDQDTGYAIPERSGVIRWFVRINGEIKWGGSPEELKAAYPDSEPKSLTFIASSIHDNRVLMEKDPGYMANLKALQLVDRERLLNGNWKIRPAAGLYFKRRYFEIVEQAPQEVKAARGWDLAATDKSESDGADSTAGLRMIKSADGYYYITDLLHDQLSPAKVEAALKNSASQDGRQTVIRIPQDPGQAGKAQVQYLAKLLSGYIMRSRPMTGDKVTRAGAFSSACENGLVRLVRAPWNETFLTHAEAFPPKTGSPDIIDAAVEAFDELSKGGGFFASAV